MTIQRLRINGWDVADCYEIVEFSHPTVTHPYWQFVYKNGDCIEATGQVSFLLKAESKKDIDTGNPT